MNNKYNKIIINASLTVTNNIAHQIIQPNIVFSPDYVLNVNLGLLDDFVNFNQFFNIATYDENNTVNLEINTLFINNLLFNSDGFIKFDTVDANIDVVNNPAYLKLDSNEKNLNDRCLEILATKIYSDPTLKNLILNKDDFINDYSVNGSIIKQIIDGIDTILSDPVIKADILNTYSQLPVYTIPTDVINFDFRNTYWDFPIYLKGHVLNDLGIENNTFNGPNMGGSTIINGIYNIPILLRFYGESTKKIITGGFSDSSNNILAYSYNLYDWINGVLPELNKKYVSSINCSLFSQNLWIVGGLQYHDGSNNILTSVDGINWNYTEKQNTINNILSMATNNTQLVARYIIGAISSNDLLQTNGHTVIYSYNKKEWFSSSSGNQLFNNTLAKVIWNGNIWVGVGLNNSLNGIVGYSYDGIKWTKSISGSTPFTINAYDVAWNGSIWVAVGNGNASVIYSSDGINWIVSTSGSNLAYTFNAITWNGTKFIAGSNLIIYSSDGINWTQSNTTLFSAIYNISSNSILSIASGKNINQSQLAYSTDNGITWIQSPSILTLLNNTQAITSTCWNGTYWLGCVISINNCVIIKSTDGINWTNTGTDVLSISRECWNLSWDGIQWIVVGNGFNGSINETFAIISDNGSNWTKIESACSLIVYGKCTSYATILPKIIKLETEELIVASGTGNFDLMTSLNSSSWNGINLFSQTNSVIWIGNKWICGGPNGLAYSYNGTNWTILTIPFTIGTVNVLYWNGFMVLAGLTNGISSIIYSYDGIIWFPSYGINTILATSRGIYSLSWGNNKWIIGTINTETPIIDSILYSLDVVNWISVNSSNGIFKDTVSSIIWNGNEFIASGYSETQDSQNILNYSMDLINWISPTSINNILLGSKTLNTDYSNYYNLINSELHLPNNIQINITDLSSQKITWLGSSDYYLIQIIDSTSFTKMNIIDLSSNTLTINSNIILSNEHLYYGIISGVNNTTLINSTYFKFWSFKYTNLTSTLFDNTNGNNSSTNYGFTFNYSWENLGTGQTLVSLGIGINSNINNSIIHTFLKSDLTGLNSNNLSVSINILQADLDIYLENDTDYYYSAIGTFRQNDIYSTYQIITKSTTTFYFEPYVRFKPIKNLQKTFVSSTKINISFTPPAILTNLTNYTLTLSPADINNTSSFTISSNNNSYQLTTLNKNTTYNISIVTNYTTGSSTVVSIIVNTLPELSNKPYFTPLSIPNLSCWYDASDISTVKVDGNSYISIWNDKSSNNNTLLFNIQESTANSSYANNTVTFPSGAVMSTNNSFTLTTSSFLIAVVNINGSASILPSCIDFGGSANNCIRFSNIDGSNNFIYSNDTTDFSYPDYNINGFQSTNSNRYNIPLNSTFIVDGYKQSSGSGKLFLSNSTSSKFFSGNYYEILLYDSVTSTQRLQLEGYMAWKWNLQSKLPANHPYKKVSPNYIPDAQQPISNTFIPSNLSNLALWLDASSPNNFIFSNSTNISLWKDKSGSGYDATAYNNPIYDASNNSVIFDGSSNYFTTTYTSFSSQETAFVVFNTNSTSYQMVVGTNAEFGRSFNVQNNKIEVESIGDEIKIISTIEILTNTRCIAEYNYNNSAVNLLLNGTSVGSSYFNPYFSGGITTIGANLAFVTGGFLSGTISEVIIYNSDLSKLDCQKVEGYLASKWNLQSSLPTNHPYKTDAQPPISYIYNLPSNAIIPSNLSNLALWLDASSPNNFTFSNGTTISLWKDKSGSGYDATAYNNPIYDASNNNVIFNGSSNYFTTTYTSFSPQETAFVVFNTDSTSSQAIIGTNAEFGRAMSIYTNEIWIESVTDEGKVSSTISTNTTYIAEYNYNNNGVNLLLNGTSVGSNYFNPYFSGGLTTIGAMLVYVTEGFLSGTISEVIIYNTVLSKLDCQKIEGYLAWKWGLQTKLPLTHPFYYAPPLQYSLLTPYELPNIKMWLDVADMTTIVQDLSNNITQVNDKSRNGNNATQSNITNSPKYTLVNGLGIMSFNGTSSKLTMPDLFSNQSFTIFLLIQRSTANMAILLGGGSNINTNEGLTLNISNSLIGFYFTNLNLDGDVPLSYVSNNEPFNLLEFSVTNTNRRQIFINGLEIVSDANTNYLTNVGQLTFGYYDNSYGKFNLGEVIILNGIPDILTRKKLEGYFNWKWGINTSLPSNHSYINTPPPLLNLQTSYTPDLEGNLTCWFDATDPFNEGLKVDDGTLLTGWVNKVNNSIATVNSKPAIIKNFTQNNLSVVRFNGQSSYLINYNNFPNTAYTIFVVVYNNDNNTKQILSKNLYLQIGTQLGNIRIFTGSISSSNTPTTNIYQKWSIISITVSENTLNTFINGIQLDSKNGTTGTFSNLYIGGDTLINNWVGDIGEILIYSTNLSDSKRQKVEGYLAWKWGINNNLILTQTYKYLPPTSKPIFNPSNISGIKIWFDSTDSTTLDISNNEILKWKNKADNTFAIGTSGSTGFDNKLVLNNSLIISIPSNNFITTSNIKFITPYRNFYSVFNLTNSGKSYILIDSANTNANKVIINTDSSSNNIIEFNLASKSTILKSNAPNYLYNSPNVISTLFNNLSKSINVNSNSQVLTIDGSINTFIPIETNQLIGNGTKIDVAEIILVDGNLSTEDQIKIDAYLSWKWGLVDQLPSNNNYKTKPPSNFKSTFNPTLISSLSLWLDGSDPYGDNTFLTDSSDINTWYDKSGFNRNAIVQTFPNSSVAIIKNNILNNLPIIRFNGNQKYLVTYPFFPNTQYTVFTVQSTAITNSYQRLISGSDHDFSLCVGVKNNNIATFTGSANENWNDTEANSPNINNVNSWKIVATVINKSILTPYVNGTAQNTKVGTTQTFNNLYIGGVNSEYWNGDIADIMIFNETLSQNYRQKIEGYLAWKWNLVSGLPNNHPYKYEFILEPVVEPVILLKAINYSGSGDWLDETDNNRDATLENGIIAKNNAGNGIILNGSTSWTFPNVAVGNAWSANVWYKNTGNQTGQSSCILTQLLDNSNINLQFSSTSGKIKGSFYDGTLRQGTEIQLINGLWTNIQITWNGTNMKTYINGSLLGTVQPGGVSVDAGTVYSIGRNSGYMIGEIGEIRIYNYAINELQVMTDYNNSVGTFMYIDPNQLSFVKLYINSKDTDNIILEDNQIISITNKTTVLTSSILPPPIYSNHSIYFYQTNCYLTLNNSIINNASNYCMFFVFKLQSFTNIFYKHHEGEYTYYINVDSGVINIHLENTTISYNASSNITLSINTIYLLTIIWNGTNLVLRVNGTLDSSSIEGFFNIPDDSSATFTTIGLDIRDTATFNNWNLYDFIYCDSLISLENVNILEGFLAWKWNLQVNLPFNHEYKNKNPLSTDILPFKPSSLPNLNLWLDAGDITTINLNNNLITHWYDKSGLGNDGVPFNNSMIYDASSNSVRFDNTNYFTLPNSCFPFNDSSYDYFIIINPTITEIQTVITTGGTSPNIITLQIDNSGGFCSQKWNENSLQSAIAFPVGQNNLIEMSYIIGGERTFSINFNKTTDVPGTRGQDNTNNYIGGGIGGVANFEGLIYEVIIYNTVLSTLDRQKVEGYLAWKWGLVSLLPSDHPYYNTPVNSLTPNEFSPYSLGSVNTWLDGSDLSNMFTDTSLNTVITSNNQKISLWRDKSPNSYYFKQSDYSLEPSIILKYLNNLSLINFNNQMLESYSMPFFRLADSGGTFFFVFDSNSSSATTLLGYQNQTLGTYNNTETFIGYSFNSRTNRFGFSKGSSNSTNTNDITIDMSFNLISNILASSGGSPSNILIYKNGIEVSVSNVGSGYYSAGSYPYQNNSVNVTIGGAHLRDTSENLFQNGNIAEIIWFNYPLTSSERQKIEGYLAWKWGLQSNLSNTHAFYSGSPTLQLKYTDFTPLVISELQVWLDASSPDNFTFSNGTNISLWKNKSGNGYDATAYNNPIYDASTNSVIFDGSSNYFTITYTSKPITETVFIIVNVNRSQNNLLGSPDANTRILSMNSSTGFNLLNGSNVYLDANITINTNTIYLINYTFSETNINFYTNGSFLNSATGSFGFSGKSELAYIGIDNPNLNIDGSIYEIIIYNQVLSTLNRQKVEGYLAWKWGIQTSLPSGHPYLNFKTPPQSLPLPDQNVFVTMTLSSAMVGLNDTVIFTAVITGIYKFVSSTWTVNSNIISQNTISFSFLFDEQINYTIVYTLITLNSTYTTSFPINFG